VPSIPIGIRLALVFSKLGRFFLPIAINLLIRGSGQNVKGLYD
jgi:hypothetical protein